MLEFVDLVSLACRCACPLSSNSSGCVVGVACARSPAVLGVSACVSASASSFASAPASFAVVAHARSTPTHDARNSWSDTGRNSRCTGGLLPVCKSTSYNLEVGSQGPTGRRCTKGGVSGPAEDLRPVSEVESGVNFRPAGGVRGQVAGLLPRRQPGTGTRQVRGGAVTPSIPPGGSWYPIRVTWKRKVTPGHDCLCSYKYGHGAAVRPQTNNAIWDGVIGFVEQGRTHLITLVW